ncbi:MAG: Fic family protein [Actinomycetota bacterium]|nr:Fic family protein [Actinomycetota bacterium]
MQSFIDLDRTFGAQPRDLGGVLARIDTGRGQEKLFLDQRPELLKRLSENARIASITASNAIEGVVVESIRAEKIVEGSPRFRNRNEKEFAGYRDAVDALMRLDRHELLTVPFVLHLHRQLFEHTGARGGYLKTDDNLIVSYESGLREVIFTPPEPKRAEFMLSELLTRYNSLKDEGQIHPLVLIGGLVVDLLAIHPVADGNGRLARLVTTHELLSQGYGVARYISIEQRILESKNTYYDRLYRSQRDWHEGKHDIWPWTSYLAQILAGAYDDFEHRVAVAAEEVGSKQGRVRDYILKQAPREFRRRDIERALPEVSHATIRLVLNDLRDREQIVPQGAGPTARWRRT